MSTPRCPRCHDTGKVGTSRHLDCTCEVATIRARIDGAVAALRRIGETEEDIWWNLYQMGEKAGREAPGDIVTYSPAAVADVEAVRWAHNMLEGMAFGQGPIGAVMMERLKAMLRKV